LTASPVGPAAALDARRSPILLASGHRLFFLAAALWASTAMPLWLIAIEGGLPLSSAWHGHEMLFGFAGAALDGHRNDYGVAVDPDVRIRMQRSRLQLAMVKWRKACCSVCHALC